MLSHPLGEAQGGRPGASSHLCCHGEFSPRHRETVAFPQNLTGSEWMLGFSWKCDGMGEHWGVPTQCQGTARVQLEMPP